MNAGRIEGKNLGVKGAAGKPRLSVCPSPVRTGARKENGVCGRIPRRRKKIAKNLPKPIDRAPFP